MQKRVANTLQCHLQGPKLRHVVETGHRQSADVVVVKGAEETENKEIYHGLTGLSYTDT